MAQTFEEYKKEIQDKLPKGYILDEDKMDKLKEAFDKGEKINEQDFAKPEKDSQKHEENNKDQKDKKVTRVSEDLAAEEENANSQDVSWKEAYAKEWKLWGDYNHLEFKDASIPTRDNALSFRFYEGKSKDYAAEITYSSPYNISLRGSNGQIPDSKYFEKAVSMAVNNGTAIEFGNISSPEFKAKLLAACYKQGNAQIVNGPTEEEMSKWPDELKKMVADAQAASQQQTPPTQEQTQQPQEQTPPQPEMTPAMKRIAELRKQIETRQSKLEDATKEGKTLSAEEQKAIEQEGMSAEEIKLRELRGQAKAGDKKAGHELDTRRYNTMTDEFKYKRLTKEENGKEVFVKDDNGNYIYETDDKGKKIKSDAYKAFLAKAGNNLTH